MHTVGSEAPCGFAIGELGQFDPATDAVAVAGARRVRPRFVLAHV